MFIYSFIIDQTVYVGAFVEIMIKVPGKVRRFWTTVQLQTKGHTIQTQCVFKVKRDSKQCGIV